MRDDKGGQTERGGKRKRREEERKEGRKEGRRRTRRGKGEKIE